MASDADISDFMAKLAGFDARVLAAVEKAVHQFAHHVVGDAQELAPVDTGALKASATVGDVTVTGSEIRAVIGFNTEYAAAVHERTQVFHAQGQAKYLDNAMRKNADKFLPWVADAARREVGGA